MQCIMLCVNHWVCKAHNKQVTEAKRTSIVRNGTMQPGHCIYPRAKSMHSRRAPCVNVRVSAAANHGKQVHMARRSLASSACDGPLVPLPQAQTWGTWHPVHSHNRPTARCSHCPIMMHWVPLCCGAHKGWMLLHHCFHNAYVANHHKQNRAANCITRGAA